MNENERRARDLANELFETFDSNDQDAVEAVVKRIESQALWRGFLAGAVATVLVLVPLLGLLGDK